MKGREESLKPLKMQFAWSQLKNLSQDGKEPFNCYSQFAPEGDKLLTGKKRKRSGIIGFSTFSLIS